MKKTLQPSERKTPFVNKSQMAGLYDLEETLGKGHFAVVKAAKHVFTGERVAVKVIDKTKLDTISQKALLKEVLCMKLVQHPNVVRLYEVIDTTTKMYLVLELGSGDLYDLILKQQGGLTEEIARKYFSQILSAVSYCHKLHVAHRDLKPENVVFFPANDGMVKLTDFGFSNRFCPGVKLDTSCGSLAYSAPEILLGDAYDAPKVDIWSLGVILYMLVSGRAPFQEANDSETLTMIMDVKYSIPQHVSGGCRNLIQRMLVRFPEQRATLEEIQSDPWVILDGVQDYQSPLVADHRITPEEKNKIIQQMVDGSVASREEILEALSKNAYNHMTSTFFLLTERLLRERKDEDDRPALTASLESLHDRRKNSGQSDNEELSEEDTLAPLDLEINNKDRKKLMMELNKGLPVLEEDVRFGEDVDTPLPKSSHRHRYSRRPPLHPQTSCSSSEDEDSEKRKSLKKSLPPPPSSTKKDESFRDDSSDETGSGRGGGGNLTVAGSSGTARTAEPTTTNKSSSSKSVHNSNSGGQQQCVGGTVDDIKQAMTFDSGLMPLELEDSDTKMLRRRSSGDQPTTLPTLVTKEQITEEDLCMGGESSGKCGDEKCKLVEKELKGRKRFFSWFFLRKRKKECGIYKTRSCAELKVHLMRLDVNQNI